jgi:thymidylate synthase (FAD)
MPSLTWWTRLAASSKRCRYAALSALRFNVRSLMHFLDLRAKLDAQLEIQALCELMMVEFEKWTPAIAAYYKEKRWGKARLAP